MGKNVGVPVVYLDNCSFMYSRQGIKLKRRAFFLLLIALCTPSPGDMYVVAVTKSNSNATLVFQYLYKLVEVFRAYFGGTFDENGVRENLGLIYELLDGGCRVVAASAGCAWWR